LRQCYTSLLQKCNMTHSEVQNDSFICTHVSQHIAPLLYTSLIRTCDISHLEAHHDSFICINISQHLAPMLYISDSEVQRDSFRSATQQSQKRTMTHPDVHHDSFTCINMGQRIAPRSYGCMPVVGANSFICATRLIPQYTYRSLMNTYGSTHCANSPPFVGIVGTPRAILNTHHSLTNTYGSTHCANIIWLPAIRWNCGHT